MERLSIVHAMQVRAPSGRLLGRVIASGDEHILVDGRGPAGGRRWALPYGAIASLAGGTIHLKRGLEDLLPPDQPDLTAGVLMQVMPLRPDF